MGGVSIMSDSLSGAQSAFTARQTLYYQKKRILDLVKFLSLNL